MRGRRPSARHAAALGLLASAAVVLGSVGSQPAAAAPDQAATAVELVEQSTWLHAGDEFHVRVRLTGAPAGASLRLVVHDRLVSRAEFQGTLEGELGGVDATLPARPLAELGSGAASFTTGFVVGGDGRRLSGPGVYPVEVQLIDAQGRELTNLLTHLTYLPDPDDTSYSPLAVAVVVDVSGPPALQPDGSVVMPSGTIARARERADLLAEAPDVPLTVAPQPETLDGLAGSGRSGAATLAALVRATGDRPLLARPYTDVDLAALSRSGLSAEADDQTEAGAAAVRTQFGRDPVEDIWLSGPTLGDNGARQAVDLDSDRALVPQSAIVDDDSGTEAGAVPDAPVSVEGGLLTMVSDPALTAHLTGDNGVIDAQRFLAELAMMWFERPATPRAVAVRLPADATIDPATVARGLEGLTHGQAVRAVPLPQVFEVPPDPSGITGAELASHAITDDLDPIAGPLRRARRAVDGLTQTVDSADAGSLARSLLLATGSATPDDQRGAYVERVTRELGSLRGNVDLPDQFRITLTSRTSNIPVNITNSSDQPLKVRIEFDSGQLEFLDGDVMYVELPPGATRLEVRVRSLTSGAFPMGIRVTSPDRTIELDSTTFDVRSTAVTGVGYVLSIGAGLFLAAWWARHWRKARRSRHLMPAGTAGSSGPAPGQDELEPGPAGAAEGDDTGDYQPAHLAGARPRRS
jgi:Family of unknown function (DUF6049)